MTTFPPAMIAQTKSALVSYAGGYLRNPLRLSGVTCAVCFTPVEQGHYCDPCSFHRQSSGIADRTCSLTYAFAGEQSGYVMRGYKAATPVNEHVAVVAGLMILGGTHNECAERIAGVGISHWSFVPSLPHKPGEHPFRRLARTSGKGAEVQLKAAEYVHNPRSLNGGNFQAPGPLPPRSHVLLMDDTWVAGGHIQSAALALRRAGAAQISTMTAARWLKPGYGTNREFIRAHLARDFDTEICPWTGGSCPVE